MTQSPTTCCTCQQLQAPDLDLRFLNFRLSVDTAATADGARAVCVFVNDVIDKGCL